MTSNKYYVSGVVKNIDLDLGVVIEAENAFMAAIRFHRAMHNLLQADKNVVVTEVETMQTQSALGVDFDEEQEKRC